MRAAHAEKPTRARCSSRSIPTPGTARAAATACARSRSTRRSSSRHSASPIPSRRRSRP